LPAKSGVSGALVLVVPGVMGIGLWSPSLDALGNTVRGVSFAEVRGQYLNNTQELAFLFCRNSLSGSIFIGLIILCT
jgi:hypothetical protein